MRLTDTHDLDDAGVPVLSIAEISARLEIGQILTDYATAVDSGRFDDLDAVFTPDATIDYSVMGGIVGSPPEVKVWLAQVLPLFRAYCHLLGNVDITVHDDAASSRTLCLNPMLTAENTTLIGLWYVDHWRLTSDGWRIDDRRLERCFDAQV